MQRNMEIVIYYFVTGGELERNGDLNSWASNVRTETPTQLSLELQ